MNTQDPKYQQKSEVISSAEPNYFVHFAMRYPVVAYSPKQKIPRNINPYLIVTAMKGQKHMNVHQNATNKPLEELILRKNKQHENLKKGQSTKDLALR